MTIGSSYFFLCAIVCIAGAIITIMAKNPIRGALGLLTTVVGIAGMFLQLNAQFLAAIQLIVYAGAVVVLFVFVLMLLGADATDKDTSRRSVVARTTGQRASSSLSWPQPFAPFESTHPRVPVDFPK